MTGPPPDRAVRIVQQCLRRSRGCAITVHVEELAAAAANVGVGTSQPPLYGFDRVRPGGNVRPERSTARWGVPSAATTSSSGRLLKRSAPSGRGRLRARCRLRLGIQRPYDHRLAAASAFCPLARHSVERPEATHCWSIATRASDTRVVVTPPPPDEAVLSASVPVYGGRRWKARRSGMTDTGRSALRLCPGTRSIRARRWRFSVRSASAPRLRSSTSAAAIPFFPK